MAQPSSGTPRAASARLLTMKFMQRAAASSPSSPSTPKSDGENSAKRRKVTQADSRSSPVEHLYDRGAIQAALDEEERRRQAAIERQAAELGDSRWSLEVDEKDDKDQGAAKPSLNVVQVGFAQIDSLGAADESELGTQQRFQRFNMKSSHDPKKDASDDDDDSTDSSSSDGDEDDASRGDRGSEAASQRRPPASRKKSAENFEPRSLLITGGRRRSNSAN